MLSKQVVAMILGGGAGSRLYPLTASRSKPAVPIAGKYRLVDIPISNCINSSINRMFVLTQYNSASLNKHIKNTYQFSGFSSGFVVNSDGQFNRIIVDCNFDRLQYGRQLDCILVNIDINWLQYA